MSSIETRKIHLNRIFLPFYEFLGPETDIMVQFLDPETDVMVQLLAPRNSEYGKLYRHKQSDC